MRSTLALLASIYSLTAFASYPICHEYEQLVDTPDIADFCQASSARCPEPDVLSPQRGGWDSDWPTCPEGQAVYSSDAGEVCRSYEFGSWGDATYCANKKSAPPAPTRPTTSTPPTTPSSGGYDYTSDAIGVTPGSFRVSEAGAATYAIPILAAPGIAGVKPQISLNYSSAGGNGIAGRGWSIGGVSKIERCRKTLAVDGAAHPIEFDGDDAYCLDGARLIQVATSGANIEYRTEIDQHAKIVAYGATDADPDSFTVWRKDGTVSEYGNTGDSRQNVPGQTEAMGWAQNELADNMGNAITFSYIEYSHGEQVIDSVRYASAEIQFTYASRNDSNIAYVGGHGFERRMRLTKITSSNNNTVLRTYSLSFQYGGNGQSQLTEIAECRGSICYEPTVFTWNNPSHGLSRSSVAHTDGFIGGRPADLNGDGTNELLWVRNDENGTDYIVAWEASGNGWSAISHSRFSPQPYKSGVPWSWTVVDFNNDGRDDLMYQKGLKWYVRLGQATASPSIGSAIMVATASTNAHHTAVMDVDSDGLPDVAFWDDTSLASGSWPKLKVQHLEEDPTPAAGRPYEYTTAETLPGIPSCPRYGRSDCLWVTVAKLSPMGGDFNGDGKLDFVVNQQEETFPDICEFESVCSGRTTTVEPYYWQIYVSGGSSFSAFPNTWIEADDEYLRVADINGDGLSDLAYYDSGNWLVRLSTGTGLAGAISLGTAYSAHIGRTAQFIDYDRDGDLDFMFPWDNYWYAKPWNGDDFGAATATDHPAKSSTSSSPGQWRTVFIDRDADGRLESVTGDQRDHGTNSTLYTYSSSTASEGTLKTITNGFGAQTQISYAPLTDSSVYSVATDANTKDWGYPVFDVLEPIWVVKQVKSTAPAAGSTPGNVSTDALSSISYYYTGMRMQASGRGSLGFETVRSTDDQTGIRTTTTYRQDFPYTGRPAETEVETSSGDRLSIATNTWANVGGNVERPYLQEAIEKNYATTTTDTDTGAFSVSDTVLSQITVTTTMDATIGIYGDVSQVVTTTQANGVTFKITVSNEYAAPDVTNWRLGRLRKTTVTHDRSDNTDASVTRTSSFTYTSEGLLASETIEPDHSLALTSYYSYDSMGNRTQVEQKGGNESRHSYTTFDAAGQYVTDQKNHYGHRTRGVIARNNYGQVTQEEDVNNALTKRLFDLMGRPYRESHETGNHTTLLKRLCSNVTCPGDAYYREESKDATGLLTYTYFDSLGRTVRTATRLFAGNYSIVAQEYDELGRVKFKSEPHAASSPAATPADYSEMTYDELGRTTRVDHAHGSYSLVLYDGLTTRFTDPEHKHRYETKNGLGELVEVEDHNGGTVQYTYDEQGNLAESRQQGSGLDDVVSSMTYDVFGRKTGMTDADMGSWSYSYNAFGELVSQTDAKNQTVTMSYDRLGRMVSRIDNSGDSAWVYDTGTNGLGQLHVEDIQVSTATPMRRTYAYDAFGRPDKVTTEITRGAATESYEQRTTYDGYGRVFQQFDGADADSGTENTYNSYGYLSEVHEAKGSADGDTELYYEIESMDARGNVTQLAKGGITVSKTYETDSGRLTGISTSHSVTGALQWLSYHWDDAGNLTQRVYSSVTETYSYDNLHRLTDAYQNGTYSLKVRYNALGNITNKRTYDSSGSIDYNGGHGVYTYASGSHRVIAAGSQSYTYDANGSVVSGDSRSISYGAHGKPVSISKSGRTVHLYYGPDRARYQRIDDIGQSSEQSTHYVGSIERIWRANGDEVTKRYIANEVIVTVTNGASETQYLLTDHLGNTHIIVGEDGNADQHQRFDPFGARANTSLEVLSASSVASFDTSHTTRSYTGHEGLDAVGLVHMNGRVYDPRLGRFISGDPIVQFPNNTQSLNRYSYVLNNPLRYTDPSGFSLWTNFRDSILKPVVFAAVSLKCGPAATACYAALNAAETYRKSGNVDMALKSGAFAAVSYTAFTRITKTNWHWSAKGVAMGSVQGVLSDLQGGKFGHGFVSAAITIGAVESGYLPSGPISGRIAAIIVGGTASVASGGKFANGAAFAAFSMAVASAAEAAKQNRTFGGEVKLDIHWDAPAFEGDIINDSIDVGAAPTRDFSVPRSPAEVPPVPKGTTVDRSYAATGGVDATFNRQTGLDGYIAPSSMPTPIGRVVRGAATIGGILMTGPAVRVSGSLIGYAARPAVSRIDPNLAGAAILELSALGTEVHSAARFVTGMSQIPSLSPALIRPTTVVARPAPRLVVP